MNRTLPTDKHWASCRGCGSRSCGSPRLHPVRAADRQPQRSQRTALTVCRVTLSVRLSEPVAGCPYLDGQLFIDSLGNFAFGHLRSTSGMRVSDAGTPSMPDHSTAKDHHGKSPACHRSAVTFTRVIDDHSRDRDDKRQDDNRSPRQAVRSPGRSSLQRHFNEYPWQRALVFGAQRF